MSIGLLFMLLSFALGSSIILVLQFFPKVTINYALIYLFCVFQGIHVTLTCYLRGQELLAHYAISNILLSFFSAVFNILFIVILKYGVSSYFIAYILAYTISCSYCFFAGRVYQVFPRFHIDSKLMKEMVQYSIVLVPNSFMWWVMNSSDHVMVTSMISIAANGIYAISYKIPSIVSALSLVFNQAWMFSAISEEESEDKVEFHRNMFDKLMIFQLLVTVILLCLTKPILKIYVEDSFYEAWQYVPYLLVGNFFLTLGTYFSTFYMVHKDSKGILKTASAGALCNVLLNLLFIPFLQIHGAALATLISYFLVFLYRFLDTRRYLIIHAFGKKYVIGYLLLFATAITVFIPGITGIIIQLVLLALAFYLYRSFLLFSKNLLKQATRKLKRS